MKRMKREKGQYGYRNAHQKRELAKILFGAAAILIQLGARSLTEQEAWKNILTVMAILSVLPTANVAASFLAAVKYRTAPEAFHQKLSLYEGQHAILYDLIITSKELILPMDGICVHPTGVYCYCSNPKILPQKAEKFLNEMFSAHRLDPHAKVITDEKTFFKRMEALKPSDQYEDDGSVGYTLQLLKDISM